MDWQNAEYSFHTVEESSLAIKRNENVDARLIMDNRKDTQVQKITYCLIPFIWYPETEI